MRKYVRTPGILQMEMAECGAASLCMVLACHGCHVSLEEMRVQTGVSRDGCTMRGIKAAAVRYGMEAHVYRRGTEQLKEMDVPSIIHWNSNHFVVFEGCRGRFAYINDPAVGRRRLTPEELDEGYSGVVMTLRRTDAFRENRHEHALRAFVAGRLKGERGALLQVLLSGLALIVPSMLAPLLVQGFVDRALGGGQQEWLPCLLALLGGCMLLRVLLVCCRSLVIGKLRARMTLLSLRRFLEQLFRLPISFFEQRYTGDLVSRAARNAGVSRFLAEDLAGAICDAVSACAALTALLLLSPSLTLAGLLGLALCGCAMLPGAGAARDAGIREMISGGELNGVVSAAMGITASIKAAGLETETGDRLIGCHEDYAACERELMRRQQILSVLPESLGRILNVLLFLGGARLVMEGRMTPGALVAYVLLFPFLFESIGRLAAFPGRLQQLGRAAGRMMDVERHEQSASFHAQDDVRPMTGKLSGNVVLRDVTLGYSPLHPPVIGHLNLVLRSGEMIAVVGASGCGKSTLIKVLGGLYSPWSGEVLLDGVPLGEIPRAVFCNSVATVSQTLHLFSGTIRDNLTLWDPTLLQADIDRAVQDACMDDFIMRQPGGYEYRLDEAARNLSGGERQRLEIARALARRPSLLIMDEATSALDPLLERRVMENIRRRGCTCVLVTHRLSATRDCSRILVMKQGQIVEQGTHAQLMRADGEYAALMRAEHGHAARKGAAEEC